MSSFSCERCNANVIDSEFGYVSGCLHYKTDKQAVRRFIDIYLSTHVSELWKKDEDFVQQWRVGQNLYHQKGK